MCLCVRENISNVSPQILWCRLQCGASVGFWLLGYWPGLLDTAPRSGGSLPALPVGGQPKRGWVAHYSWGEKKKKMMKWGQLQESWSQKYLQSWYVSVCPPWVGDTEIDTALGHEHILNVWKAWVRRTQGYGQIWVHALSNKVFIGNRWGGDPEMEIWFQEHQQLTHSTVRSLTNGHI